MPRKKKQPPQPEPTAETAPATEPPKPQPITVKKQQPSTKEEQRARDEYLRTSREIERQWWQIIH